MGQEYQLQRLKKQLNDSQKELEVERTKNRDVDSDKIYEELNKRYLIIFNDIKERFKKKSIEYQERITQLEEDNKQFQLMVEQL